MITSASQGAARKIDLPRRPSAGPIWKQVMNLRAFFCDERSRRSAVARWLIRARIYLLTGFFVAGVACVTLATKHSGASSVLKSLASSAPSQPATERLERISRVTALAQPGVALDHPPSDPTTATAPLRALEPIGSPSQPNNNTAGASSPDRQPAKASAAPPHRKAAKARAKRAARVAGRQYSRGYGPYGGYGTGYVGGP